MPKPRIFGSVEDPNIDNINRVVQCSLSSLYHADLRERSIELDSGRISPIDLTPDKPYTGKCEVPVYNVVGDRTNPAGKMQVILFGPNDGTGNERFYPLEYLIVPKYLQFEQNPARVVPRDKPGISFEIFFPILTISGDKVHKGVNCLDETSLTKRSMGVRKVLGLDRHKFKDALEKGPDFYACSRDAIKPQLTIGYDLAGRRFGDPHAIARTDGMKDVMQVAGFITVKESGHLCDGLIRYMEERGKF